VEVAGFPPSVRDTEAKLRVTVSPIGFEGQGAQVVVPIRILPQTCVWPASIDLEDAHLWYTWDIGIPRLYSVTVSLELDGSVSDEVSQTFGFRQIERKQGWETFLNGFRIYQRGANYLSDQLLSTMTRERYEKDVDLLREANLNTVHPFCVIEKQTFYDVCDEVGILVYQDFPMWLEMDTTSDLVRRATQQMRELIVQFGHHPSIFVWNCGSQPSVANFEKLGSALAYTARELDPTRLVQQSNAIVDYMGVTRRDPVGEFGWGVHTIQDFKERYDWRIDTHQYYGWYYRKKLEDLATIPLEHLELITEYGAQALPSREMLEKSIPENALFPPVWPEYTIRCFQREVQFQFIEEPTSLEQFIQDSQAYQARFLQHHTEYYRRLKFNPCNGSHMFCFNDCWAAITWSVVDYDRERKPGFFALQRAMAPVQALLEPTDELRIGKEAEIIVWIVNDLPRPFHDMTLAWTIANDVDGTIVEGGELECGVDINSLKRAGGFTWTPEESGVFNVVVQLSQEGGVVAQNQYRWTVSAEPEPNV
jgi:beta-mannosidase